MKKANEATPVKPVFVDAQEMAKKHPETFLAPPLDVLDSIDVGRFVKVCTGNERFWVEVYAVKGEQITGRIDNDLVYTDTHGLVADDVIQFEKKHIYDVLEEEQSGD